MNAGALGLIKHLALLMDMTATIFSESQNGRFANHPCDSSA